MKAKNEYLVPLVLISLFVIIAFLIERNLNKVKIDIQKNSVYGVGKIFFINSKRSFTDARYVYFYNGNKYESGEYIDTSGKEYLNKCFIIKFSSKNPNHSEIFLNQEIKDTIKIRNAGL